MALPFLRQALEKFANTDGEEIVRIADQDVTSSDPTYSNYLIWGECHPDAQAYLTMWVIVGLPANKNHCVVCHACAGEKPEESMYIERIKEIVKKFQDLPELARLPPPLVVGLVQGDLGVDRTHVIGMVSLHRVKGSNSPFAVLWVHPNLSRASVEYMMKLAILERFSS